MTKDERQSLRDMLDVLCEQVFTSGTFACQEVHNQQRRIVEHVDMLVRSRESGHAGESGG